VRYGDRTIEDAPTFDAGAPIALDGIAYGVEHLEALVVIHLGDAHVHAAWVRADLGFRAEEIAPRVRDAYRACESASRGIDALTSRGGDTVADPAVLLEAPGRTLLARRVRSYVVVALFEDATPLGMARLVTSRLVAKIEPELPYGASRATMSFESIPLPPPSPVRAPEVEPLAATLAYPPVARPSPRPTLTDLDRARRLLAYVDDHAPEPHVARLRLALRAGITPLALEHPETLRPEAMVLLETAAGDLLGVDRAEIRRLV
jgi:hypothetical protein